MEIVDRDFLSDPAFQVQVWGNGTCQVVQVAGEVDAATAGRFSEALDLAMDKGPDRVRIDLTQVEFFACDGIRCLVAAKKQCDERGIRHEIVPSRQVRRVLEITRMVGHVGVRDTGSGASH